MSPLKSKFSLLVLCAVLACLGCLSAFYVTPTEAGTHTRRRTSSLRSLARSSGRHSSSNSASRSFKRPSPASSTPSSSRTSPSSSASHQTSPNPAAPKPPATRNESSQPQQVPQASSSGPPPPAYPYGNEARGSYPQAAGVQASTHWQGHGGAPGMQQPPQGAAQPAAAAAPAAQGGGGPSFVKTAASSAVGAVVGSMAGTALANSLTNKERDAAAPAQETSTTTSGPTVTIAPDVSAAAQSARSERANVLLTFLGIDEANFKSSFGDAEAFGKTVQDAVARSLGVPAERVVLEDVSVTTTSSNKKGSNAVVRLTLLPPSGLLSSEPSARGLAEEIRRQLDQTDSNLATELRLAAPQLPTALVETIGTKIMVEDAKVAASKSGAQPFGAGLLYTSVAAAMFLLL
ncbi:hypothetical protein Esti_006325 [Eimeria stiedai]